MVKQIQLSDRSLLSEGKELRLILIVDYQINSLWFNWAQTEQLWKDLLYRTQRKTGNRPTKKVAKERIQGKIRGSSTKNMLQRYVTNCLFSVFITHGIHIFSRKAESD